MKTGLLLLLLFAALPAFAGQPDPAGFAPVPKEKIDGMRLLLKEHFCSIALPSSDRKWLVKDTGKNYMCFNKVSGASYAVSTGDLVNGITEHVRDEVVEGAQQQAARTGLRMSDIKWEEAPIPIPKKSWRLTYLVTLKGGAQIWVIMYVVETSEKTLVTMQDSSPTGADSAAFKQFVSSLKVTK